MMDYDEFKANVESLQRFVGVWFPATLGIEPFRMLVKPCASQFVSMGYNDELFWCPRWIPSVNPARYTFQEVTQVHHV